MRALLAAGALLLAGCAAAPAPRPVAEAPPAPASEGAGQPSWSDSVRWVAASAEYRAALHQAFQLATERIERLAAGRGAGTWAIVVDADETIISNVRYEMEREPLGEGFSEETWREWVERRRAPPLPDAVAFLRRVGELGGRIAVVSNRLESVRRATAENLERFDVPFDFLLLKPDGGSSAKEPRWEAVEAGTADPSLPPLEVLLWVGDNIRDFPGLDQGTVRRDPALLEPFGDRFILLPNPLYGSWEREPVPEEPFLDPATGAAAAATVW